jgi:hypothetical protein
MGTKLYKDEESELSILYVVMSRLMKDVTETHAYKLGLIDKKYNIIKEPEVEEEYRALSPLNIFIFKLKRALGTRIMSIFRHMYLNNFNDYTIVDKLAIKGNISSRGEIRRLKQDINSNYRKENK